MGAILVRAGLLIASLALAAQAQDAPPQTQDQTDEATDQIVVSGRIPHCKPRDGDPLDAVDVRPTTTFPRQEVIAADPATGEMKLRADDYPETGLGVWQRDGTGISQFVFRVPTDRLPMCMGSRRPSASGFVQLRQAFSAKPYWGQVLRFTAFVATQRATNVRFWLAAGTNDLEFPRNIVAGGDLQHRPVAGSGGRAQYSPIAGSHGWTPISYVMGPLPCNADQLSFGVTLDGGGDVWIYKPSFEVLPDESRPKGVKSRKEFLATDQACRKKIYGAGN